MASIHNRRSAERRESWQDGIDAYQTELVKYLENFAGDTLTIPSFINDIENGIITDKL